MLCRSLALVKGDAEAATGIALRCNCWHCDHCRPYRQRQLKRTVRAGQPTKFITLTSRKINDGTPDDAAARLMHAWQLLVKRIKRRLPGATIQYLWVFEATKAGWPHLHVLARMPYLPHEWLSAQMAELNDSPIVGIERIESNRKAAAYIAKYCGKALHKFSGVKRYSKSQRWIVNIQQWKEDNEKGPGTWVKCNYNLAILATMFVQRGFAVSFPRPDCVVAESQGPPLRGGEASKPWWHL